MNLSINLSAFNNVAVRFDAMSIRERALVTVASLAVMLMLWNAALMQPLSFKQKALQAELDDISTSMSNTATALQEAMEPRNAAMAQIQTATTELAAVDTQLKASAAGMISPQHMAEVIQDVLHQQHALTLVSIRNGPASSLVGVSASNASSSDANASEATPSGTGTLVASSSDKPRNSGPYIHPLELVVEGNYSDIVDYLHALETMPWHLYWNRLELQTRHYPLNRVTIEMSTLSLDSAWLGV